MGAFELEGKVRTPEKGLLAEHTKALLETIITQKWEATQGSAEKESVIEVDESLCLSSLQASGFPADPVLVQCVLHNLGRRVSCDSGSGDNNEAHQLPSFSPPAKWYLAMDKVKLASARMLLWEESLKTTSTAMSLADFLLEWRLRTPGMRLQDEVDEKDMALLRGLAVLSDDKTELHYLPVEAMQSFDVKVCEHIFKIYGLLYHVILLYYYHFCIFSCFADPPYPSVRCED